MKAKKMNWFVRLITFNRIMAITLWPFGIYIKEEHIGNKYVINHEAIHWEQQKELPIVFYLWYLIEWLIKLPYGLIKVFFGYPGAYYSISFEREAYRNQANLEYIGTRKKFTWIKYIICNR